MLRRLSALSSTTKLVPQGRSEPQFADNSRVNIPFTKEQFAKVHAQYAINIRDYLQMPEEKNEVKLITFSLVPDFSYWPNIPRLWANIGAYGCAHVSYGQKTFVIEINLPNTEITKGKESKYPANVCLKFKLKILFDSDEDSAFFEVRKTFVELLNGLNDLIERFLSRKMNQISARRFEQWIKYHAMMSSSDNNAEG